MLLNGTPFAFVIDLAALASRREYLKLDKWLTDKIREHGVCLFLNGFKCTLFSKINKDCWFSVIKKNGVFYINFFVMSMCVGTFYPGVCDIPEKALPIHHGGSGP